MSPWRAWPTRRAARAARPSPAAGLAAGLRGRLGLLLVLPDREQRLVVGDVGHRVARALRAEPARRLAPALGPHAELLAQQRDGDLRLVGAEPGQLGQPPGQLRAGRGRAPDLARVAVVALHDQPGQL